MNFFYKIVKKVFILKLEFLANKIYNMGKTNNWNGNK